MERHDRPAGRGARSNRSGRFERNTVSEVDDGWGRAQPADERAPGGGADPDKSGRTRADPAPRGPRTTVTAEHPRTILTRNDSPDVPFEVSINPYKGCEHGCIYCFARPTHAYLGLSPGLDFETRIFSKPDAAALLTRELARPGYRPRAIALGANTDPYQPAERRLEITRSVLEVLRDHDHPLGIVTKSSLVLRDLDILGPMAERGLAHVYLSITTLDRELARRMEPRASTPAERLEALGGLAAAGVPCGVLASPMIPALNDHEAERILEQAAAAGATSAGYILLRLPLELKELFEEWLEANYPLKAAHVLSMVRDSRGGELYRSHFGERMCGTGAYADLIAHRFDAACARLGLARRSRPFDTSRFRVPRQPTPQLDLFGLDDPAERRTRTE